MYRKKSFEIRNLACARRAFIYCVFGSPHKKQSNYRYKYNIIIAVSILFAGCPSDLFFVAFPPQSESHHIALIIIIVIRFMTASGRCVFRCRIVQSVRKRMEIEDVTTTRLTEPDCTGRPVINRTEYSAERLALHTCNAICERTPRNPNAIDVCDPSAPLSVTGCVVFKMRRTLMLCLPRKLTHRFQVISAYNIYIMVWDSGHQMERGNNQTCPFLIFIQETKKHFKFKKKKLEFFKKW